MARDSLLIALAQRGTTRGGTLSKIIGVEDGATREALRKLQRSGFVARDIQRRWRLDRRHPTYRQIRALALALGRANGDDFTDATGYQMSVTVSPFPDLDKVAPDVLGSRARTQIMLYLAVAEPCSHLEIADVLGMSFALTYKILLNLRERGLVDTLMSATGNRAWGVRLTRSHPAHQELRAFLKGLVRHLHPDIAALKPTRRYRKYLERHLATNAPVWKAAPPYRRHHQR